jgi:MFS family permease
VGYRPFVAAIGRLARVVSGGFDGNYWKLWISSAAANLADGIFWIALPLFAIQLTDSPALVAGVALVARLPWLLLALVAGALADRLDRRRTMVAVAILRTVVSAGLAFGILGDVVTLPILYVAAFVLGVGETLFDTAAQSIMPTIVDRDRLSRANGRLFAAELTMNQFVGPPLGGLLAGLALVFAFVGSALAFALGAIALSLLVGTFRPVARTTEATIVQEIREGLGYIRRHRVLRTMAAMVGVINLASSAVFAIFVLYAVAPGPIGLDEFGFGVLMMAMGVGSFVGSLIADRVERRIGRAALLTLAIALTGASQVVPGLTANALIVGASFAAWGIGVMMWNVVTVSLRQRIVPNRLLGRLNASYRLLAWGTQPLGALLGGFAGELLGLREVFILAGLLVLLLVPLGYRILTNEAIEAAELEGEETRMADSKTSA